MTWFKFEDYGHFVHVHKNAIFTQMEQEMLLKFQKAFDFAKLN